MKNLNVNYKCCTFLITKTKTGINIKLNRNKIKIKNSKEMQNKIK